MNDATLREALASGIDAVASVVSNGDDAPSTLLNRISEELLSLYKSADVIISKGMGNFEGLYQERSDRLFFLFRVKCPVISDLVRTAPGSNVVLCAQHLDSMQLSR